MIQYADTQFLQADTVDHIDNLISNTEDALRDKTIFSCKWTSLNPKKTQCIFIGNRQLYARIPPDTYINCDGVHIYPNTYVKNLGDYFDRYMLFDVHITELRKKVMGILMFLNRISEDFDKPTRKTVVESLVLSVINYCISIWGSGNKTNLHNVQKLQNFAAKIAIGGARKYDHATPLRKELQWLNIPDKYIFEKCTTVYKVIKGFYPEWFLKFPTVSESTTNMTRQENKLYIQRTRTDTGARASTVCGPKFWNNLPQSVISSGSLQSFKSSLTNLLLNT